MAREEQEISIPDLTGRRAVVTGASDGIGLEIATRLAGAGAEVLMPVRNQAKGEGAAEQIRARVATAAISVWQFDLASLRSVADFTGGLIADGRPIHILVNNAGIMTPPERQASEDGFELQFATNHLGHFALTYGILPLLRSEGAVVVSQTSVAAKKRDVQWDDLQSEQRYHAMHAYSSSKAAIGLFGLDLDRQSRAAGWGIRSSVSHPGVAPTNLLGAHPEMGRSKLTLGRRLIGALSARGILVGNLRSAAAPALLAATDPEAEGGKFYGPGGVGQLSGPPAVHAPFKPIADPADGERIRQISEDLSGVSAPAAG